MKIQGSYFKILSIKLLMLIVYIIGIVLMIKLVIWIIKQLTQN